MNSLDQAILAYEAALNSLPQQGDPNASSKALTLLIARDEVARALRKSDTVSPAALTRITALDEKLKEAATPIDTQVGRSTLANWRQSIHPLKNGWWWSLDERAAAAEPGRNPLWTIPAVLLFALSVSVLGDTIGALRTAGINGLSVFGTVMQTLLALLAGSAFLSAGREWLEKLFAQMHINRKFKGASRIYLALGVLVVTFGIRILLPDLVARYRNGKGNEAFKASLLPSAVENYQQAVALEPYYEEANFNLALAYDKSQEYAKAIDQYKRTIAFNSKNYTAYNNLARLYILQSKDYNGALRLLDRLLSSIRELPPENHYYLFKNRGWADLELHNYREAEGELATAIQLKSNGAAAHYLLGRLLDEQKRSAEAKQQWNSFIEAIQNDPKQEEEVEPNWIGYAQEQLTKLTKGEEK